MNPLKFVPIAEAISSLSKDPSTKVGAVIIDNDSNILSTGFNGFPRGVNDLEQRYINRDIKLKYVAHAEANAIAQAARVGAKLLGSILIVTALYPCTNCAKLIIQAGIKTIYVPTMNPESTNIHWHEELIMSENMFNEAGIEIVVY